MRTIAEGLDMPKGLNEAGHVPAIAGAASGYQGVSVPPPEDRSMLSVIGEANDIALSRGLDFSAHHALVVAAVMRLEPELDASVVDRLVSALMDPGERA